MGASLQISSSGASLRHIASLASVHAEMCGEFGGGCASGCGVGYTSQTMPALVSSQGLSLPCRDAVQTVFFASLEPCNQDSIVQAARAFHLPTPPPPPTSRSSCSNSSSSPRSSSSRRSSSSSSSSSGSATSSCTSSSSGGSSSRPPPPLPTMFARLRMLKPRKNCGNTGFRGMPKGVVLS